MRHLLLAPTAVLAAITLVAACGGDGDGGGGPGPNPPAADVAIVQGASTLGFQAYDPDTFTVTLASGGVVTWRNDDNVSHTVTDTTAGAAFDITVGTAAGDDTISHVFTAVGEYPYLCKFHNGMRGLIIVTP